MRAPRLLLPLAFGSVAILTAVYSVLALVALNAGGEVKIGGLDILRVAAGFDRRAEPLLMGRNMLAPRNRREAAALSRSALEEYPYDTGAWLRISYVDWLDHGSLTPVGLAALKHSYDLVAVDSYVGLWRVRFALENSQALSPELRRSVREEASALWRNGENQAALLDMRTSVHNDAGRLSVSLWLNRLQSPAGR